MNAADGGGGHITEGGSQAGADLLDPGTAFLMEAFAEEHRADPYPLYARMRAQSPVLEGGNNLWFTFGHDAAHSLLRAKNVSSDEKRSAFFATQIEAGDERALRFAEEESMMLFLDPPDHTRLRSLVSSAFTPRTFERLVPRIQSLTDELLDELADAGADGSTVDLISAFAHPLPVAVICELLGVPRSDEAIFGDWSNTITQSLDPGVLRSEEDNVRIDNARDEVVAYIGRLLERRRDEPGNDLVSALLHARDGDDKLSESELVLMVTLLLIAGHETTVNLIGNGLVALLRHPDQLQRWQADPQLDKRAVDEILRFDSPVQLGMRVATEPLDVSGVTIPAGDQIISILGAANRDPAVFVDPDTLDLARSNAARNMSFGGGIHHCLGMALARTEGQIALGSFVRRFPSVRFADEPTLRARFVLRGYDTIPVTID